MSVASGVCFAQPYKLPTPSFSEKFGTTVTVLSNGNFVVTDPYWPSYGQYMFMGAVYLYNGQTNALISTLTGSRDGDYVGFGGITALSNGNYVVNSPYWDPFYSSPGAVTWCNGTTGLNGVIDSTNSLVSTGYGNSQVWALSNGNYVVGSYNWDNGNLYGAGAATWCNGLTGRTGTISITNSLVGDQPNEHVGAVTVLSNNNYIVSTPNWANGSNANAGAVTLCNGSTGTVGAVSVSNSLVGSQSGDKVGLNGILPLGNNKYIVKSFSWANGTNTNAGALTWCSSTTAATGVVSSSNSLVGAQTSESIGSGGIKTLSNGNLIVHSPNWKNGMNVQAGAITWVNSTTGITGTLSSTNSLVGSQAYDGVGSQETILLNNGAYVVRSPYWDNGIIANAGAVTWCSGTTGKAGFLDSTNSLVGKVTNKYLGDDTVLALSNGNYVVAASNWDNGTLTNAGAVTWCNGATGRFGFIDTSNSFVGAVQNEGIGYGLTTLTNGNYLIHNDFWSSGSGLINYKKGFVTWCSGSGITTGSVTVNNSLLGDYGFDQIGSNGIIPLANGNYVVNSPYWHRDAGAVTWCNGTTGRTGIVSDLNSLTGSLSSYAPTGVIGHRVGDSGVVALSNGNYLAFSPDWGGNPNGTLGKGAVTWGNGTTGITGFISSTNSLIGGQLGDKVGAYKPTLLKGGNYLIRNPDWKNGNVLNAGAVTWGNGTTGISGVVSSSNSLVGTQLYDQVGQRDITLLSTGNYLIVSPYWNAGPNHSTGAVTWGSSTSGITGTVTKTNSLTGSKDYDYVGHGGIMVLDSGRYIVESSLWSFDAVYKGVGAFSLSNDSVGLTGIVSPCNSITGSPTLQISPYTATAIYNPALQRMIVSDPGYKHVSVFSPVVVGLPFSTDFAEDTVTDTNTVVFTSAACQLIAAFKSITPVPLTGKVTASVYLQPTTPSAPTNEAYSRRYYSILPADSADFRTAKITLYFTQAEFDDYNSAPGITSKLPQNSTDAAGKTALRVTQQKGTSVTGDFGSFTGFGGSGPANVLLIPGDSNVVWNAPLSRWEISFPVTGFGGFFLSAGNDAPLNLPAEIAATKGITVSPIPATNTLTITNSNAALAGSTVTALNLQGQVMATATLSASTQLDVQAWPAGIYLLKFADGSVQKVVKQ